MVHQRDEPKDLPTEITFHYIKSNLCRVIHVDGLWGGITNHGNIFMALFSEHQGVPEKATYQVTSSGSLGEEKQGEPNRILREIESEVVLSLGTAIAMRNWLDDKIKALGQFAETNRS